MTRSKRFAVAAFIAAVLGASIAAFAPLASGCTETAEGVRRCRSESVFDDDGARVLVVVIIPIVLALVPVLLRRRWVRVVSAVLLWACCVVGLLSIGIFFVPAAVLMTISASIGDRAPRPAAGLPA
ncbi:MAG: hypothetical protein ACXWW5_05360 [Actinomycetota bacterium]